MLVGWWVQASAAVVCEFAPLYVGWVGGWGVRHCMWPVWTNSPINTSTFNYKYFHAIATIWKSLIYKYFHAHGTDCKYMISPGRVFQTNWKSFQEEGWEMLEVGLGGKPTSDTKLQISHFSMEHVDYVCISFFVCFSILFCCID